MWHLFFRIWPGRGTALETTFKQEIVQSLKELDPAYADWMVSVNYEVEKNQQPLVQNILKRGIDLLSGFL